jgi:hypothetical protein
MSEALYGLLQGLEITLRNSIHRVLSDAFGRGDWYEVMPLYIDQRNAIIDAKKKLTGNSKSLHPHRMIAELTFGFWTSLTGPRYAQTLWDTYLKNAFPESNVGRKAAQKRLRKIRFLRNRIAHHECIVGLHPDGQPRNLEQDERDIMDTIRWICPVTEKWIKSTSSFAERFAKRPQV